ncbi:YdeI/OmpD-associated family protein [Paracoccus sp. SSJ]|uniref:YdeI/OmpD-associated family protein n=1 Tax=Paracoccus sp. SSJ TaxID=3050636 RepID=UPI00254C69AF|nr:YdeI/OmpD-associated family protein [Paracoccus sp. SSJ]MDK8875417.1 YdeI/OmpD-associated family protein [Paracoccus sp. SSJ]
MAMITDAEDFFTKGCGRCARFATPDCSTRQWIRGLNQLRRICRDMGLEEVVKWAHPTYMHAGRNIAIFGAFRGDFRLSFMNPALLRDSEGVLEPQGPNSRTPGMIRFTEVEQVSAMEPVIRAYLRQLMDHAEAGTKPPKVEHQIDMPVELAEALDADPELAEAFHALTPGRQKSYLFNLNQARQSVTRMARVEKFRDKIIAGKGATER